MVEMLVPLIVTRSVVAPAVEPVVDAVPSSVDARRLTPLTRASEKGQRLTGEAHPGIYRVCAVITQAVRAAANRGLYSVVWSRLRRCSDSITATPPFTRTSRTMSWFTPTLVRRTPALTPL